MFAPLGKLTGGMEPRDVFDNASYSEECVAGAATEDGGYSKDLTPGGFCDLQKKVRASHEYKLV